MSSFDSWWDRVRILEGLVIDEIPHGDPIAYPEHLNRLGFAAAVLAMYFHLGSGSGLNLFFNPAAPGYFFRNLANVPVGMVGY